MFQIDQPKHCAKKDLSGIKLALRGITSNNNTFQLTCFRERDSWTHEKASLSEHAKLSERISIHIHISKTANSVLRKGC